MHALFFHKNRLKSSSQSFANYLWLDFENELIKCSFLEVSKTSFKIGYQTTALFQYIACCLVCLQMLMQCIYFIDL